MHWFAIKNSRGHSIFHKYKSYVLRHFLSGTLDIHISIHNSFAIAHLMKRGYLPHIEILLMLLTLVVGLGLVQTDPFWNRFLI